MLTDACLKEDLLANLKPEPSRIGHYENGNSNNNNNNNNNNNKTSKTIRFERGLPQGDSLCLRLFTLSLNPLAWKLAAKNGYKMSKPTNAKITDVLYIDDLKVYAQSESKLSCVLKDTNSCMNDLGLPLNHKKCNVIHVKRGEMKH